MTTLSVSIELEQKIYDSFMNEAKVKGLTPEELLKFLLGNVYGIQFIPVVSIDNNMPQINDLNKMSNIMIKTVLKSGMLKCENCTMPLTMGSIRIGKCQNCDMIIT